MASDETHQSGPSSHADRDHAAWMETIERVVLTSSERGSCREDAADLLHAMFLMAWEAHRAGTEITEGWLVSGVSREMQNLGRRKRRRRAIERVYPDALGQLTGGASDQGVAFEICQIVEFCHCHEDGRYLLEAKLEEKTAQELAVEAGTTLRTMERRLSNFRKKLCERFGSGSLALALLLGPEWAPPAGVKASTATPRVARPRFPPLPFLLLGLAVVVVLVWFLLWPPAPAPGPSLLAGAPASPRAMPPEESPASARPALGVPLATAATAAPSAVPSTHAATGSTGRFRWPRPALLAGPRDYAALCHPELATAAPMTRVALATLLLTWWPLTDGEGQLLNVEAAGGPRRLYSDVVLPALDAATLDHLFAVPTASDCAAIDTVAVYIASVRTQFHGQGGCFGQVSHGRCPFEPANPANAAELVSVVCRALLQPDGVAAEPTFVDVCQPVPGATTIALDAPEWEGGDWYSGPPRVLMNVLPDQRDALRTWLAATPPAAPVSYSHARLLLDLLPKASP